MQPKGPSTSEVGRSGGMIRAANFYALSFASQMIVWATRRRLLAVRRESTDDDVLRVFHMAEWGEMYTTLLALVDTIVAGASLRPLHLHAVSCPCLSPHETHLLNAMAHAQTGRREEALLCLCEFLPPSGARLALPQVCSIAEELGAQGLGLVQVEVSTAAVPTHDSSPPGGTGYVH